MMTGRLDSKLYTKPSNSALHLPYTSHHPLATFHSILLGEHRRSLIAASSHTAHAVEMLDKFSQFKGRGYPTGALTSVLLQETTTKASTLKRQRVEALTRGASKVAQAVIPLKLPFTPRTECISQPLSMAGLQERIAQACPALSKAALGRLVTAHLKTRSLKEHLRPRGFSK